MKLFLPDLEHFRVFDIDLNKLFMLDYKGLLIDIDNTLVAHNFLDIARETRLWFRKANELNIQIVLITYNFEGPFVDSIAEELDAPIIKIKFPYIHLNRIKQAAKMMNIKPNEIATINDFRIALTVLKIMGCTQTILVEPVSLEIEQNSPILRFLRWFEKKFIEPKLSNP